MDTAKDLPNGLYTNDASLAKGKEYNYNHKTKTGWHSTHKHGDAMDIKFATKNDVDPSGMKFNKHDEYSQPKTIKLIDTLGNNLQSGYNLKIYFNDTSIIKHYNKNERIQVQYMDGHNDHLHIILQKKEKSGGKK